MHNVDGNLIAVQWGLIGVFGVVVGLLISPADQNLQKFLASGADRDHRRAARWAWSLWITSWLVLAALFGLSAVGARDAGLLHTGGFETGAWLLLTPLLAQAGFVILVLGLVNHVPKIVNLYPEKKDIKSPEGHQEQTVIRFINRTSSPMLVSWLNFEGQEDADFRLQVSAHSEVAQSTYEWHVFKIVIEGVDIGIVQAAATPGRVVIEPDDPKTAAS